MLLQTQGQTRDLRRAGGPGEGRAGRVIRRGAGLGGRDGHHALPGARAGGPGRRQPASCWSGWGACSWPASWPGWRSGPPWAGSPGGTAGPCCPSASAWGPSCWPWPGARRRGWLAVPGSVVTAVGLILLVDRIIDQWQTWAYTWTLVVPTAYRGRALAAGAAQRPAGAVRARATPDRPRPGALRRLRRLLRAGPEPQRCLRRGVRPLPGALLLIARARTCCCASGAREPLSGGEQRAD